MAKIIIGVGFGGLNFSNEFDLEYISRKYPDAETRLEENEFGDKVVFVEWGFSDFGPEVSVDEDGRIFLDESALRKDPVAIQVLEEGENDLYGDDLITVEVPNGTRYFIASDEGCESIVTEDEIQWEVA